MKANEYIAKFIITLDELDKQGAKVPGLILSHAGFGKTSTIKKFCEYFDYNLITLIPSMYSSDDILGLQSVKENTLVRLTPSWFNHLNQVVKNKKRTLLFIDEITTCDPYIQGPLLDLIFNGNLGDAHLPENVFIIAAGNYAEDLNNVFKMSDPLINRFVLLNLETEDFNIEELLTSDFNKITSKKDIAKLLGIKNEEKIIYNYDLFKEWVLKENEINFGKTSSDTLYNIGLVGFASIRSLDNSFKFIEKYMNTFGDDLWVRVAGDTLGTSHKREGSPMRLVLNIFKDEFLKENFKGDIDPHEALSNFIRKLVKEKEVTVDQFSELENILTNIDYNQLTGTELSAIDDFILKNTTNPNPTIAYKSKVIWDNLSSAVTGIF